MQITQTIVFGLIYLFAPSVDACINSYAFDLGASGIDKKYAEQKLTETRSKIKTDQDLNDYGVLLIYAHRYTQAIEVFQRLEKQHPNLAKTAANLGTAYELSGQVAKAKYWITQGMKRDPNIHHGSEWVHLKILDAQAQQKKDTKWIQTHDVLGLDFGQSKAPQAKITNILVQNQKIDLDRILVDSQIQMNQRLQFVRHDPITAQIVFNMANIEVLNYNTDDATVALLYKRAGKLGFADQQLLEKRENYFLNSKWFRFKAFWNKLWKNFQSMF